ncbi:MAG: V-type ATPase subunit [Clostridia bacterium]|nr:V-type ATPase subunit [Clostridia bacterium]
MADYLYGSAHVRALENAIVGRDRMERLLQAKSTDEAYAMLSEFGIRVIRDSESGAFLREATLLEILKNAYRTVAELAPDSGAMRLWLYPYDCNNLKAAIKGFFRKIDPQSMMFDFGTADVESILKMVSTGDFSPLPSTMRKGAADAVEAYAKTKNPQVIDLILDRACYADMLEAALADGNPYVVQLVQAKIDLVNLMMTVRILRMKSGEAGKNLLRDALITGGRFSDDTLLALYDGGEEMLWEHVRHSAYEKFATAVAASDRSLTAVERSADDVWMEMIRAAKWIPVGQEAMVAFLLAHEYEVRNLRIVLAGKEAGLPVATVRERIRENYV